MEGKNDALREEEHGGKEMGAWLLKKSPPCCLVLRQRLGPSKHTRDERRCDEGGSGHSSLGSRGNILLLVYNGFRWASASDSAYVVARCEAVNRDDLGCREGGGGPFYLARV
jgi:hypothetical protein